MPIKRGKYVNNYQPVCSLGQTGGEQSCHSLTDRPTILFTQTSFFGFIIQDDDDDDEDDNDNNDNDDNDNNNNDNNNDNDNDNDNNNNNKSKKNNKNITKIDVFNAT